MVQTEYYFVYQNEQNIFDERIRSPSFDGLLKNEIK